MYIPGVPLEISRELNLGALSPKVFMAFKRANHFNKKKT